MEKNGIVLIADRTFKPHNVIDLESDSLEMISDDYFTDIWTGLTNISNSLTHYNSPADLIQNAHKHQNDLVFTVYGGRASRNRMALVPAICEGAYIRFAGADAYARIVCQDKFLSKAVANRYKINSPRGVLIENIKSETLICELDFPVVVKPNFEGSSIGIQDSSLAYTFDDAMSEISKQFAKFKQPILVEEFVSGAEVCICIVGHPTDIKMFEVMEVLPENNETFFHHRLYTAKHKHHSSQTIIHRPITNQLREDQKENILALYKAIGKMDFMRVDGRVKDGQFTLIELTPDGYVGSDSSFADAYLHNGKSYEHLLCDIIHSASIYYQIPYSSYIKS